MRAGLQIITPALLLGAAAAAAAPQPLVQCQTAQQVSAQLSYCSDNVDAVNTALDCYDELDDAWKAIAGELNRSLLGNQERAASRQRGELQFSESDYATSVRKMDHLIATTKFNLERIRTYPEVMLNFIGAESLEDSSSCYKENVARLREVEKGFEKMIVEATAARDRADNLRLSAGGRRSGLQNDPALAMGGNAAQPGHDGRAEAGASDVTGTAEDNAKRAGSAGILSGQSSGAAKEFTKWEVWREEEAKKLGAYLRVPAQKATAGRKSAITKSEALEVFTRPGPVAQDFEAELSSARASRAPASIGDNEAAQREAPSVGAFFFQEGGRASSVKLELKADFSAAASAHAVAEQAAAGAENPALSSLPANEAGAGEGQGAQLAASSPGPSIRALLGAPPVRTGENSLFSMVSERYRRTELFRRARVSDVPLASFEAKLAR